MTRGIVLVLLVTELQYTVTELQHLVTGLQHLVTELQHMVTELQHLVTELKCVKDLLYYVIIIFFRQDGAFDTSERNRKGKI